MLGTGGVHIAGDDLDAAIMWHKIIQYFGHGATYVSWGKRLPIPAHVFATLCAWERMPMLREDKKLNALLREARATTDRPQEIDNLIDLIDSNGGYWLFRQIEKAKIALSGSDRAVMDFSSLGLDIAATLGRREFENSIAAEIDAIGTESTRTLKAAGLSADRIDAAYITGGTSLVPAVRSLFADLFGTHKIRERGTFSSVAEGLVLTAEG